MTTTAHIPLAEKLRPRRLSDIVGQEHLLGDDGFLTRIIAKGSPLSILLWGPPGCGKTSIARLYAKAFELRFEGLSAAANSLSDVKEVIKRAKEQPLFSGGTVLFLDEIHRFNKAQQDALLPHVEDGTLTLVGATTENPSFHLNNALLSRMRVLTLKALDEEGLLRLLGRCEEVSGALHLENEARRKIVHLAQGDGRYLCNLYENLLGATDPDDPLDADALDHVLQRRSPLFDKGGDGHYDLISALHKSVRGSDPDASLYWLARMLQAGEDPLFLARRLIRMASEDVGLADPQALTLAIAARDAYQMLGSPEGELALAQATIYLALAPKSNAAYVGFKAAVSKADASGHEPPPKTIVNAPTTLMKQLGHGAGYQYDHDTPNGFSGQNYLPESIRGSRFYNPVSRGFEREMQRRIAYFDRLRGNQY
jgi:putative ATPase